MAGPFKMSGSQFLGKGNQSKSKHSPLDMDVKGIAGKLGKMGEDPDSPAPFASPAKNLEDKKKMTAAEMQAPMKDKSKAIKSTDKGAESTILPTVNVSAKKLELKNKITRDKKTGEEVYIKSKGSKSAEYVKNPKWKEGAPGNNNKWIRRDGARDQYGPVGFSN